VRLLPAGLIGLALAVVPATTEGDEAFTVSPSTVTVTQFLGNKMRLHVHCAAPCDVDAQVGIGSTAARRLGILTFSDPPVIGTAQATMHAAGDFDLPVIPSDPAGDVQKALGFALFKELPVTIVAHSGSAQATAKTSLRWPKQRAERGGHGDGPFIKSITGPRRVSLRAKVATFKVRIARIPGARLLVTLVVTPGNHFTSGVPDALPNAVADRGGTFTIKVPIRRARGHADAVKLAPLAAELSLGLVTKRKGDNAIFRFTLVR